jgi:hypothetical protein
LEKRCTFDKVSHVIGSYRSFSALSRLLLPTEVQVHTQGSQCGISGGQTGTGMGSSQCFGFPVNITAPLLHICTQDSQHVICCLQSGTRMGSSQSFFFIFPRQYHSTTTPYSLMHHLRMESEPVAATVP